MTARIAGSSVFIDACCLAGALRRNMLLSLAEAGFYRVLWSETVMQETARAIAVITNGMSDPFKQIQAMLRAFPEAMIVNYDDMAKKVITLGLRDMGDAHVLAAALTGGASLIVTDNIKDFPSQLLAPYGLSAKTADHFIADCIDHDTKIAMEAFERMRLRFKRPDLSWDGICQKAEAQGLAQTATRLRELSQSSDESA